MARTELFIAGATQPADRYLSIIDPAPPDIMRLLTLENGKIQFESMLDIADFGRLFQQTVALAAEMDEPTAYSSPCWVNAHGAPFVDRRAPFGGFRSSGMGREFGMEGVREFTDLRSVTTVNHGAHHA